MAKKAVHSSPTPSTLPPSKAALLLRRQVEKGRSLLQNLPISYATQEAWEGVVEDVLIRAYGADSPNVRRVMDVNRYSDMLGQGNEQTWARTREHTMRTRIEILESLAEGLEGLEDFSATESVDQKFNDSVFVVHGHDMAIVDQTARVIAKLGLKEIILHEQPNQGSTIIEKFEAHSNVGFAVVLLTGDDVGKPKSSPDESLKERARQNVIFELGYFIGKLGRRRVCALYQKGVEIPSDYSGVVFIPLDEGAWRWKLGKELQEAGYKVDLGSL